MHSSDCSSIISDKNIVAVVSAAAVVVVVVVVVVIVVVVDDDDGRRWSPRSSYRGLGPPCSICREVTFLAVWPRFHFGCLAPSPALWHNSALSRALLCSFLQTKASQLAVAHIAFRKTRSKRLRDESLVSATRLTRVWCHDEPNPNHMSSRAFDRNLPSASSMCDWCVLLCPRLPFGVRRFDSDLPWM